MKHSSIKIAATLLLFAGPTSAEQITVSGPLLGADQEALEAVLAIFAEQSGHEVSYVGSDSFEQQIVIDTEAGSPPNVAFFPQPGLAADLAELGHLTPISDEIGDWVRENYAAGQSWIDLGTFSDQNGNEDLFGFFYKVDIKSLVWYSPENFEDAGYEVPETMEDLIALSDQMVADGSTPWCIGLGSGAATGWPATDWVEDLLLRTQSPDVYDGWVNNSIPFTDDRIVAAIDAFGTFARNDDYVAGGTAAVASTDFRDSPRGLFSAPPQCYMHRQGGFTPVFFPEDTVVGEDADFFYFPSFAEKDLGNPVLGSGTLWTITKDSQGAHDLIAFLQTVEAHEAWMAQGGFLTPLKTVDPSRFADATSAQMNEILLGATTFRFDGSDLMPGGVGAGTFWTGMVDFVGGKPAADVATDIQASWDAVR